MKKQKLISVCLAVAMLIGMFAISGAVSAETKPTLAETDFWVSGVQIRTTKPALRFIAHINTAVFNQNDLPWSGEKRGMLILPKSILGKNELTVNTAAALNIQGTAQYQSGTGFVEYTGCMTSIPETKQWYSCQYVARAYVKLSGGEYLYSDPYAVSVKQAAEATAKLPGLTQDDLKYLNHLVEIANLKDDPAELDDLEE